MAIPVIGTAGVPPACRPEAGGPNSSLRERDVDAAVLASLVLDLAERHRADLGGIADMGAAAWLQVDLPTWAGDLHQPDATGPDGRLHRHRPHQFGTRR